MHCPSCGNENESEAERPNACRGQPEQAAQETHRLDVAVSGDFVGRHHEIDTLVSALEGAIRGRGRLLMLAGDPGIGKTRTVQELATIATRLRARVLWGRCYEGRERSGALRAGWTGSVRRSNEGPESGAANGPRPPRCAPERRASRPSRAPCRAPGSRAPVFRRPCAGSVSGWPADSRRSGRLRHPRGRRGRRW